MGVAKDEMEEVDEVDDDDADESRGSRMGGGGGNAMLVVGLCRTLVEGILRSERKSGLETGVVLADDAEAGWAFSFCLNGHPGSRVVDNDGLCPGVNVADDEQSLGDDAERARTASSRLLSRSLSRSYCRSRRCSRLVVRGSTPSRR